MEKRRNPRAPNTSILKQWNVYLFIYLFIFVNGGNEITRKYPNKEETDRTWNTMQQKKIKERRFVFLKEERRFVWDAKLELAVRSRCSFFAGKLSFQLREPTCSLASCIGLAACWRARASCESGIVLPACRRHHFFQANCCPLPVFFLGLIITRIDPSVHVVSTPDRWHRLPTTVPQKGSVA